MRSGVSRRQDAFSRPSWIFSGPWIRELHPVGRTDPHCLTPFRSGRTRTRLAGQHDQGFRSRHPAAAPNRSITRIRSATSRTRRWTSASGSPATVWTASTSGGARLGSQRRQRDPQRCGEPGGPGDHLRVRIRAHHLLRRRDPGDGQIGGRRRVPRRRRRDGDVAVVEHHLPLPRTQQSGSSDSDARPRSSTRAAEP